MAWPSASMIGWSSRALIAGDVVAGEELHRVILPAGNTAVRCSPMDTDDPRVRLERDGNVAVVTLDDPARRNALSLEVTTQLAAGGRRGAPPIRRSARSSLTATPPGVLCRRFGRRPARAPGARSATCTPGSSRWPGSTIPHRGRRERAGDRRRGQPPARVRRDPVLTPGAVRPAVHGPRHPPRWRSPLADATAGRPPGGRRAGRSSARRSRGEEAARVGLAWRCVDDDALLDTAIALRAARRRPTAGADRTRQVGARRSRPRSTRRPRRSRSSSRTRTGRCSSPRSRTDSAQLRAKLEKD